MKTLVIHPKDHTTDFLKEIYEHRSTDWTIITERVSKSYLKEQIKNHDRIILLGHGSGKGLFGHDRIFIDSTFVYSLRKKECIGIWCHANVFFRQYSLKGFCTGMIISDYEEAINYAVKATDEEIEKSNSLFVLAIRTGIRELLFTKNIDNMAKAVIFVLDIFEKENPVVEFNKNSVFAAN